MSAGVNMHNHWKKHGETIEIEETLILVAQVATMWGPPVMERWFINPMNTSSL